MKLSHIKTKSQTLTALRKLGWVKSDLQMVRGAMSYRLPDVSLSGGPMITVTNATFMITGGGSFSTIPNLLRIRNTAGNAGERLTAIFEELRKRGIVEEDNITELSLAVAIGAALAEDWKKFLERPTSAPPAAEDAQ
jgi:hypothetical protein